MIQDAQTNTIYVSSKLKEYGETYECIERAIAETPGIHFCVLENTKDIWCRDFMPIQISKDITIGYCYNPDYLQKNSYCRKFITNSKQYPCTKRIDLTLDGGNVVKCDDIVVMTEKVFAENDDKTSEQVLKILNEAFEAEIVILPWNKKVAEEEYGHSDGIVHYVGNGTILLNNYCDWTPKYATELRKVLEDKFKVIELTYKHDSEDNWAYINHVRVGNLILLPQLNIPEDKEAYEQIAPFYPDCKIVQIPSREIVKEGGAINCVTWNVYLPKK